MSKHVKEITCQCSAFFKHDLDGSVECKCSIKTEHASGTCWACRDGLHTSPKYYARLKKLPQFGGKATD